jgi:hypothetical protein
MPEEVRGRRESVIFPPREALYSIGVTLCLFLFFVVWVLNRTEIFLKPNPLGNAEFHAYLKSAYQMKYSPNDKSDYQMIYVTDGKSVRLAAPEDVQLGSTQQINGSALPLELSASARARHLVVVFRGPKIKMYPTPLHKYLKSTVYKGAGIHDLYKIPLIEVGILYAVLFPLAIYKDVKRYKKLKYGWLLRGSKLCRPEDFIEEVHGDGIGIQTSGGSVVRIQKDKESHHIEMIGDTGSGKIVRLRIQKGLPLLPEPPRPGAPECAHHRSGLPGPVPASSHWLVQLLLPWLAPSRLSSEVLIFLLVPTPTDQRKVSAI